MTPPRDKTLEERVALFRHALIARLLPEELTPQQRGEEMRRIINQRHTIPGTTRERVAESTVRHWLRDYQRGGFDALKPRARADRGEPRSLSPELSERFVQIKEENPRLPVRLIIEQARKEQRIEPTEPVAYSASMGTVILAEREHRFWSNVNTHSGLNVNIYGRSRICNPAERIGSLTYIRRLNGGV